MSKAPPLWPAASDRLIAELRRRLKPRRFNHVLGVLTTALGLGKTHGLAREPIGWAALLHDCCKGQESEDQRKTALECGETIPPEDEAFPGLWHAWAAAGVARRDWGIEDPEILEAIRHHSTGREGMGRILKTLILSDYLEPTRGHGERFALWTRAHRDLDAALAEVLRRKCEFMRRRGQPVHPRAQEALDSLINITEEV